jgi:N-acetyl-alpha-D-muramate 1-phosphate uridylyltransferase
MPSRAMVLAAGFGVRMKPLTDHRPKPLIEVGGKTLIDHVLDRLAEVGVERIVVNVHYLADALERHLAGRRGIVISDERAEILETGGGIVKALPLLGEAPFFLVNSDTLWVEKAKPNLARLAEVFDPARMDALLLLAPAATSVCYSGRGDYALAPDGRLKRRRDGDAVPFVYASAAILSPPLFADAPPAPFSLTRLFDRAEGQGRLHGLVLDGVWMHVGTPDAIPPAEAVLREERAGATADQQVAAR